MYINLNIENFMFMFAVLWINCRMSWKVIYDTCYGTCPLCAVTTWVGL